MKHDITTHDIAAARGPARRRAGPALLIAAVAGLAAPALARPPSADAASRTVAYADLDLSTTAGAAILDRRIEDAVRRVCGSADLRELARHAAVAGCRREARARIEPARAAAVARARSALRLASAG